MATLITQEVTIDLTQGSITSSADIDGNTGMDWRITVPIPTFSLVSGDTYLARVRFANGRALQLSAGANLYNGGSEISKIRVFFGDPSSSASYVAAGAIDFIGVSGDFLIDPLTYSVSGGGGAFTSGPVNANLTDTAFSFAGFDFTAVFSQYELNLGDGLFDRLNVTFAGQVVSIVEVALIPEPNTFSLVGLAGGLMGITIASTRTRRKRRAS